MATLPNPCPDSYLGVEICCTWPRGVFLPNAVRHWGNETYEAYVLPNVPIRARTLREIRPLIREALQAAGATT
jgi:hypothetical protein